MKREWVDLDHCQLRIPEYDPCDHGKDGGLCGYCKKRARSAVNHNEEVNIEEAREERWNPKMESSVRKIPYGWSRELRGAFDDYFANHDRYTHSRADINRVVSKVAQVSDVLEPDEVYPHALRGHAARYHANEGIQAYLLKKFMGWSKVEAAMPYIRMEAHDLERAFIWAHQDSPDRY